MRILKDVVMGISFQVCHSQDACVNHSIHGLFSGRPGKGTWIRVNRSHLDLKLSPRPAGFRCRRRSSGVIVTDLKRDLYDQHHRSFQSVFPIRSNATAPNLMRPGSGKAPLKTEPLKTQRRDSSFKYDMDR